MSFTNKNPPHSRVAEIILLGLSSLSTRNSKHSWITNINSLKIIKHSFITNIDWLSDILIFNYINASINIFRTNFNIITILNKTILNSYLLILFQQCNFFANLRAFRDILSYLYCLERLYADKIPLQSNLHLLFGVLCLCTAHIGKLSFGPKKHLFPHCLDSICLSVPL